MSTEITQAQLDRFYDRDTAARVARGLPEHFEDVDGLRVVAAIIVASIERRGTAGDVTPG